MDTTAGLGLLLDLLKRKEGTLGQVLNICENQEALLQSYDQGSYSEMIIEMGKEKQHLIDEVLTGDSFFQKTFEEHKGALERHEEHRVVLGELQKIIIRVTELDTKIRLCEQRNQELLKQQRLKTQDTAPRQVSTAEKNKLITRYKSLDK